MLQHARVSALSSGSAPAAIGPYSPAVVAGPFVYVSGQLPIDPATGELETHAASMPYRRFPADADEALTCARGRDDLAPPRLRA